VVDDVLVSQDFSQLQVSSCGFYQDLVICIFFVICELGKKYFHFVGKAKQKHHDEDLY
jgi:hypothetical protein